MNELCLFAGIGGSILASKLLGWRTVCGVEHDPYAVGVLVQRQNEGLIDPFPIWDDISTFDARPWRGCVQVVSGGFPCQDVSYANKDAAGIEGERSGLWQQMFRVIGECVPEWVFIENATGLYTRGFESVLQDIASLGYDAVWGCIGADYTGYDHKRERLWIVANRTGFRLQGREQSDTCTQWQGKIGVVAGLLQNKLRYDIPPPNAFGTSYGASDRVDRLKGIGNAQLPEVAAAAFTILSAAFRGTE